MAETQTQQQTGAPKAGQTVAIRGNVEELQKQIALYTPKFLEALPEHIPVERYTRVLKLAVQRNGDLAKANLKSLFLAAQACAADGLLPDGKEAALVPYDGMVTYIPMIAGLRKKARNSGQIAIWDVQAVCKNDFFEYQLGDNPKIEHRPALRDRGPLIAVYSVAVMKSGEVSRDVMNVEEVEAIKNQAVKAKKGPWFVPAFYNEMAKKTVARRHYKSLPSSTDLDDLIRRDDALYDLEGASNKAIARPRALQDRLAHLAGPDFGDLPDDEPPTDKAPPTDGEGTTIDHDTTTGEVTDKAPPADKGKAKAADKPQADTKPAEPSTPEAIEAARVRGREAGAKGMARKALPGEFRTPGREAEAEAWTAGHDEATSAKGK